MKTRPPPPASGGSSGIGTGGGVGGGGVASSTSSVQHNNYEGGGGGVGGPRRAAGKAHQRMERMQSFVGCCCDGCACEYEAGTTGTGTGTGTASSKGEGHRGKGTRRSKRKKKKKDGIEHHLIRRMDSWTSVESGASTDDSSSRGGGSQHVHHRDDSNNNNNDSSSSSPTMDKTQFNVSALIPSVRKAYCTLWDTIELAMLGYYDARYNASIAAMAMATAMANHHHHNQHNQRNQHNVHNNQHNHNLNNNNFPRRQQQQLQLQQHADAAAAAAQEGGEGGEQGEDRPPQQQRQQHQPAAAARTDVPAPSPFPFPPSESDALGDLMDYCLFIIGLKPLLLRRRHQSRRRKRLQQERESNSIDGNGSSASASGASRRFDPLLAVRSSTTSMSAWKLACILKERGVDCIRCSICNKIDLGTNTNNNTSSSTGGSGGGGGYHNTTTVGYNVQQPQSTWIRPCNCPELVHRQCLEQKLGLVMTVSSIWNNVVVRLMSSMSTNVVVGFGFAGGVGNNNHGNDDDDGGDGQGGNRRRRNRMWISYDDAHDDHHNNNNNNHHHQQHNHQHQHVPLANANANATATGTTGGGNTDHHNITGNARININNELIHPLAFCSTCGIRYTRSVRLPQTKTEVLLASLSDPLSRLRACSTLAHFALCCLLIGATEGMLCSNGSSGSSGSGNTHHHRFTSDCPPDDDMNYYVMHLHPALLIPLSLKWPTKWGIALAWWQLQQSCMLHIFFSPRFAAIVDRLWMGPTRYFYCRLYVYFVLTSAILAMSYLPYVGRAVISNTTFFLGLSSENNSVLDTIAPLIDLLSYVNLAQYAVVSTMVVCIFWRTNFRIFTVADRREEAAWEWEARRNAHPIFHGQWQ